MRRSDARMCGIGTRDEPPDNAARATTKAATFDMHFLRRRTYAATLTTARPERNAADNSRARPGDPSQCSGRHMNVARGIYKVAFMKRTTTWHSAALLAAAAFCTASASTIGDVQMTARP